VLGQEAVDEKSNEITAIPALLQRLDLEGALVSIDAMGCNPTIAETIIAANADYLLAGKGDLPLARSNERRRTLPSIATTPSHCSEKPAMNR
jgi:predicted transposase YbfD/YdcC